MKFEMDTYKKKGKPIPEGKRRFTRPTSRLRLYAKATTNPALKLVEPICIDSYSPEPLIKKRKTWASSITMDSLLQLVEAAERIEVAERIEAKDVKHTKNEKKKQR